MISGYEGSVLKAQFATKRLDRPFAMIERAELESFQEGLQNCP